MSFVKKNPLTKAQKEQKLQQSIQQSVQKYQNQEMEEEEEKKEQRDQKISNIFFGHPHLDGILENKLKTGSMLVMEEDEPSKFSNYLSRYYIGSAYHSQQDVLILEDDFAHSTSHVPELFKQNNNKKVISSLDNQIAWRYQHMDLNKDKAISTNPAIPSLDLSRNVQQIQQVQQQLHVYKLNQFTTLKALFTHIIQQYQNLLKQFDDNSFKKIVIHNILEVESDPHQVFSFLNNLRIFMKTCFAMCLIVVPAHVPSRIKQMLLMQSDLYMKIESQLENQVFQDFHGLIHFQKLPVYNSFVNFKLSMLTWGIQANSKKQIDICKLYLSPDKEDQQDTEQQKIRQQQKKQTTSLCGSKPQLNNKLDF